MKQKSDSELILLARGGEKRAFGPLIDRYLPLARQIAADMVENHDIAQELAQEALLQAYLSLSHLRNPEKFKSWLCGIVLNVCRSHLRQRKVSGWEMDAVWHLLSPAPDPQAAAEERERQRDIMAAIHALSPENRAAIQLFYYEQCSVIEIAVTLGISPVAVKGRLHKARKQLRAKLLDHYPELGNAALPKKYRRKHMVRVSVVGVYAHEQKEKPTQHFVLLSDETGRRMPIYIGQFEAWAISLGLENAPPERPFTFDFMANLLQETGVVVEEVQVASLKDETYFAVVKIRNEVRTWEMDARPSDAIALAVRAGSPIFVAAEIMDKVGDTAYFQDPAVFQSIISRPGEADVIQTAHAILQQAIRERATEIRLDAAGGGVHVMQRMEGVWSEMMTIDKSMAEPLRKRFKIMADMNPEASDTPQEGLIPVRHEGREYDVRVSSQPGQHGEMLTLTITDKTDKESYQAGTPPSPFRSDSVAFRKEGVLEIAPEGWGYVCPATDDAPAPEAVYMSQSQIERFGLSTGDVITGWARPPKEDERFMGILWVETINGEPPHGL